MHLTKQEQRHRTIKKSALCVLGLGLALFVGTKIYPLLHGPEIELNTMTDGAHLTEPMVKISGIARFTKDLIINGVTLPTAPDGSFDEHLLLNPGYNIITMEGKDRFGNTNVKNYAVILTEEPNQTFTLNTTNIVSTN